MVEDDLSKDEVAFDIATAAAAIENLDLGPIKFKLMTDERLLWTREAAERVDRLYRRFLFLIAKYPDQAIVPTKEIDEFWHAHILDTMKYERDTKTVFGKFLHHFPYFGVRSDADRARMDASFAATLDLYSAEFGQGEPRYHCDDNDTGVICGGACDHINQQAVGSFGALASWQLLAGDRPTVQ